MTAATFDTLKFVETLEQAHMPREQASAIATAVQTSLAQTRADRTESVASKAVSDLRKETDSKFDLLRKDTATLEQHLEEKIGALDAKMDAQGNTFILRLRGVLVAIITVAGAILRVWPQAG